MNPRDETERQNQMAYLRDKIAKLEATAQDASHYKERLTMLENLGEK